VVDGIVEPMELGHLPFREATFEDYVGERGRKRLGGKKWRAAVHETIERLAAALEPEYVVLGGGNAKRLDDLPANVRLGANDNAFLGAFRLWDPTISSSELGNAGLGAIATPRRRSLARESGPRDARRKVGCGRSFGVRLDTE
jgi:hypothetical protein